jgi:hypothetical protein
MGAICAVVYLLAIIAFIPFPFYKDIVAATSGGGNRDVVLELERVETGRLLHRFPHSKVCNINATGNGKRNIHVLTSKYSCADLEIASILPQRRSLSSVCRHPWNWRRPLRHPLAT